MKNSYLFLLTTLLLSALLFPHTAHPLYTGNKGQNQLKYAGNRLIVKLMPEAESRICLARAAGKVTTGVANLDRLNHKFSVLDQKKLFREFQETALRTDQLSRIYILEVPKGTDLNLMKREYEEDPAVEYTQLDYQLELFDAPSDPLFAHQWYLNNTGQGYLGIKRIPGDSNDTQVIKFGSFDADIDALEAWERNDQTVSPLVGIIDTGLDLDHEDLAGNIWVNPGEDLNHNGIVEQTDINNTDDDHNGFVDDFYGWDFSGDFAMIDPPGDNDPTDYMGHGTHCAGIVAAVKNNSTGVSGINTPLKIMAVKLFPNAYMSLAAKSIVYASDLGCDVINMSWGAPYPSRLLEDAIDYAIQRGVLPVAAAGNSGEEDQFYPASYPQVFTVGASNSKDEVTYFSTYGEQIDVVAPGEDILSLRADSTDMYADGGASGKEPNVHIVNQKYYLADGTSMASPTAAGVAAYILAASSGVSIDKVKEIIQQSAEDVVYPYGGDSLYSPGKDIYSGYGRVNLNSALALISGRLARISYPYENAIVSGNVAVFGTAAGANFNNYILEYGEGYSPTTWIVITSSNAPVTNDTLGIWNTSNLTGLYTLRLTVGDQNQAIVHVIAGNGVYVGMTSPHDDDTVIGVAQVYGYTIAPDFASYKLEYGSGESPSSWSTITTSTKMVAGALLGNWLASFLDDGIYSLCLTVTATTGHTYADTVQVCVKGIASSGWVQELSSHGSLSPAVGDMDGDGYDEVVVGVGWPQYTEPSSGGVYVFTHGGARESGWPKDTLINMMSSPALGDLNKDGINDIVICSERGVHAYVSGSQNWFVTATTGASGFWSLATPVIADLENDGNLEVLTLSNRGIVYAWRSNGEPVIAGSDGVFAQVQASLSARAFPCLAVADLDQDGKNEVVVASAYKTCNPEPCVVKGGVYIWDTKGNFLLGPADYPDELAYVYGIAIANIDENRDLEIIVFGATGIDNTFNTLLAFKKNGSQVAGYPIVLKDLNTAWWFGNHPAIGDLDKDGILEIVVSVWTMGEARIYGWHQDGTPLGLVDPGGLLISVKSSLGEEKKQMLSGLGKDIEEIVGKIQAMDQDELQSFITPFSEEPPFASEVETFGSPILADVNGDGYPEIIARAGCFLSTGYERVFAWDYQANLIPGWPLYATAEPNLSTFYPYVPTIADMDKDGRIEMVLTTCRNIYATGKTISWEFDTYCDRTAMHWPKYMHDKANSGVFQTRYRREYGISDLVYLINYLFKGGSPIEPPERADVNCDSTIDISDVVYLINYLFKSGPAPCR